MKRIFIVLVFAVVSHTAFSQSVSLENLVISASTFMQCKHPGCAVISTEIIPDDDFKPLGWILNFSPSGFIILSASQKVTPVLGYAPFGSCDLKATEKGIFLDFLKQDILKRMMAWEQMADRDKEKVSASWGRFLFEISDSVGFQQWPPEGTTSTQGWLSTNWTQTAPYNAMCPMDLNTGSRSVVGCPATAMAQILNFHKKIHHTRLDDGDDYYHSYGAGNSYWIDNDYLSRDFPCFDSLNLYLENVEDVWLNGGTFTGKMKAALSFACGVTAHQVYTSSVSGTFGLEQALTSFQRFGYTASRLIYPEDTTLNSQVAEDMKIARPVQLGLLVDGGGGGHNVVVDGYNTNEFYHFNFGWGGSANGWYTLPPTSIPYNLTIIEGAVLDIIPVIGVGIDQNNTNNEIPNVYPNPVDKELWVSGLTTSGILSLFDQSGKLILSANISPSSCHICVSHVPQGSCFYVIQEGEYRVRTGVLIKLANK